MKKTISLLFVFTLVCSLIGQNHEIDIQKKDLSPAILKRDTLTIHKDFQEMKVLQTLFPGKYYDLSDKDFTNKFISWSCNACNKREYEDINGVEDNPKFPFVEGVATRIIKTINYKDSKGAEYKVLAFNHSIYDADGLQTGRFLGGLLGMAKFAQTDSGWVLKSFQPAIAAYGAFSRCPEPELLLIGENQYAFLIKHSNGGGGGYYTGTYILLAGIDGKYAPIMYDSEMAITNTEENDTSWNSTINVPVTAKKYFRDIVVTTKGKYHNNPDGNNMNKINQSIFKGIKSCNFSYNETFIYHPKKGYLSQGIKNIKISDIRK